MEHKKETYIEGFPELKNKQPVFMIDGNYFGHRAIHGIRIGTPLFTLDTTNEMIMFEREMLSELIGLWNAFGAHFGNFIMVKDGKSWRKNVEAHKPYYVDVNEKIGYKENREEKRDDINWENWAFCLDNFLNKISSILPVFNTEGLEGDDSLLLLSKYFSHHKIPNVIFATDGDLRQLVQTQYTILFRNTKSKEYPDGQIFINKTLADIAYRQKDSFEMMTAKETHEESLLKNLAKIKIGNGPVLDRTLGKGVELSEPLKVGIQKTICGDKKDNIFPLFRWKGPSGQNMRLTEAMLEKVVKVFDNQFDENAAFKLLTDSDHLTTVLVNLRTNCKQDGVAKLVMQHYKHNFRINMLTIKNIPDNEKEIFKNHFIKNLSLIDSVFNVEYLKAVNMQNVDDNANIIKTSVILDEEETSENKSQNSANQDLVNSILSGE